ncbi:hypothetical protein [Deefgea sp. CFH1-16]|uniref:hypothetical protein n=1 Tax=Deefgea sp. CFH1-16 TaxID=2675457 RepID=UPI0015F5A3B2|nr:hypothetical protein [Deefgea sp. CFH1-16]MBM5575321.1 hypothetical protein [Deefgea sp. CFH1-16]
MDPKIIGLLGTALSAIIAALSYWAKTKHERRRATRAVLYYLLEVEHLVRKMHYARNLPNDCVDEMRRTLEINGLVLTEPDAEAAVEEIGQFLHVFATAEFQNLAATIAEPFEKALVELSREDPFLAFTLRGRDQLVMLPQKLAELTASIRPSDVPGTRSNV